MSTNTPEMSDELETTNMSVSDETTDTSVVTSNRAEKPIDSDRLTDDTGEQNDHGTGTLAADDGCGSVVVGASALALAVVGAVGMMIRKKKIDE